MIEAIALFVSFSFMLGGLALLIELGVWKT